MLDNLLALIALTSPLSEVDAALCQQYFESATLRKNQVAEAGGSVPRYLYFVGTGYMRLFYPDERGNEVTTHLGLPQEFITPFLAFIHQQPAPENLAAITDCEVLRIRHANLAALIAASESFKQFSLLIFEQAMGAAARRANSLATLGAEQRYRQLLAQHPDVLLHVPVQLVASYLGIQPESLSRIRRQVIT